MGPSGRAGPHLRLVRGGRAALTARPGIQPVAVLPPGRHSRHVRLLIERTEGAPFRAVAEAIGAAVGVTDQELVIARARWFGKGTVERFRLSSVSAVKIHPPAGLRRLHVMADRCGRPHSRSGGPLGALPGAALPPPRPAPAPR